MFFGCQNPGLPNPSDFVLGSDRRVSSVRVFWRSLEQLIVFLRLKKSFHDKLLVASGQHGLFMTAIAAKNETKSDIKLFWIVRYPNENHEIYLRRVMTLKKERKKPVLFRFGTGDIL